MLPLRATPPCQRVIYCFALLRDAADIERELIHYYFITIERYAAIISLRY